MEAWARGLVGQAIDNLEVKLGQAIDGVRTWTLARIGDALRPIQAELGTLGKAIDGLRMDVLGRIGELWKVLTPIIALALPVVIPQVLERITKVEECTDPMCSVVTPTLPTLNALMDLGLLLAVGAVVGEAVRDPEGAAEATAGVVGGVVGIADGLLAEFAGIQV